VSPDRWVDRASALTSAPKRVRRHTGLKAAERRGIEFRLAATRSEWHVARMSISLAILIAAVIVASSIFFTFRWEVALGPQQPPVVRLDRWTGTVTVCNILPDAADAAARNHAAVSLDCIAP
jgi:hypothetical protein